MVEIATSVEYIRVDSEVEALIFENNLIKKYHPKYNIMMRDDKSYIYVRFERIRTSGMKPPTAKSVFQDFPTMSITRKKLDDKAEYFGPYPDTMPAKRILKNLRRVFPFCTAQHNFYQISSSPLKIYSDDKKPCFYYHIGLCKGACAGLESKEDYQKRYKNIKKFFKGEKNEILKDLEMQLKKASKELRFEDAAVLRDQISDIKYVTASIKIDNSVDDVVVRQMQKSTKERSVTSLIEDLEFPSDKLKNHKEFRIECYDISNIQGKNAVGAMTVMIDGEIRPDLYRRFKIKMENEPNDFGMLMEVLTRRFRQFLMSSNNSDMNIDELEISSELWKRARNWKDDQSFSMKPDLIIIDGGKGQLASAYRILYNFNLHNEIPIVGLAKKQEEIFKLKDQFNDDYTYINDSDHFQRILLPRRSEQLFLVQRIRDEAHRFGITYHRNLRSRKMIEVQK